MKTRGNGEQLIQEKKLNLKGEVKACLSILKEEEESNQLKKNLR